MKTQAQCLSCMVIQAVNAMRFGNYDPDKMYDTTCRLLDYIKTFKSDDSPAYNSTLILWEVNKLMGNDDPFSDIKAQSNNEAQSYYPYLKNAVETAPDRLFAAFQASVAGNIIDLGIKNNYDIKSEIHHSLSVGFACNDYAVFRKKLNGADNILFLADNSGEIVFDKLLVEELQALGKTVTYMVKGGPILNDACMKDAVDTGMTRLTRVVTTGARLIGFERHVVSPEATAMFDAAPLVIAKGMANFETLVDQPEAAGKAFCILKAKCELVAAKAGVTMNDLVFKQCNSSNVILDTAIKLC